MRTSKAIAVTLPASTWRLVLHTIPSNGDVWMMARRDPARAAAFLDAEDGIRTALGMPIPKRNPPKSAYPWIYSQDGLSKERAEVAANLERLEMQVDSPPEAWSKRARTLAEDACRAMREDLRIIDMHLGARGEEAA